MDDFPWLQAVREAAERGAEEDEARHWGWTATPERPYPFSYRWEHVQQVVRNGLWLAAQYPEADREVVLAACWLHDVRKSEKNHAERGAEFARAFLRTVPFPEEKVIPVAEAITRHEGLYRAAKGWSEASQEPFRAAAPLLPIESALLWDADKLAKVGPISHFHYMGWSLAQATRTGQLATTAGLHEQNRRYIETLVPRIIASMNTDAARERSMAQHEAYMAYHRALDTMLS
jgi:uncharacterized protein